MSPFSRGPAQSFASGPRAAVLVSPSGPSLLSTGLPLMLQTSGFAPVQAITWQELRDAAVIDQVQTKM